MGGFVFLAVGTVFGFMLSATGFAQGSMVIMPMSKHVLKQQDVVSMNVHNQLQVPLLADVNLECEIDGQGLAGEDCTKYFRLKLGGEINPKKIEIPKSGSIAGDVEMILAAKRYGLLKPVFSPISSGGKKGDGVAFEFSYQPGYLILINPDPVTLGLPKFSTRVNGDQKVAMFELDLTTLTMPAVASISAKILDKKTKKMMRFARLASDKIFDPIRKTVTLEAGYAPAKDESETCFDLIVQWASTTTLQKLSSCH